MEKDLEAANTFIDGVPKGDMVSPQVQELYMLVEYLAESTEKLKEQIAQNNILIYMKGTPYEPRCGFSAKTVQALIDTCNKYNKVPIRYYKLKSKIL